MSFPASLTVVPLHGKILKADSSGTPASGTVSFRIEQHLRDTADNVLLAPTTLTGTCDDAGEFTIDVIATDDPDVTPQGWTYVVHVNTDAWRDTFRISVPAATVGTLELADIAPAVTPPTLVTYVLASTVGQVGGPAGPLDADGLIPSAQVPGGGGGGASPSGTVTSETSYGQAATAGNAATYSRGNHSHGTPALPTATDVGADVSGAAASAVSTHVGASDPHGDRSYADTAVAAKPSLASTTPAASAVGDAGATGTGTTAARSDHVHAREAFGAVTGQSSYGSSSANGSATTVARADHTHGTPALTSSAATTSAVGDAAAAGTATTPARADHTHGREGFGSVTAQTSYGASSANGSAATPARSDHAHGTPAQDPLVLLRNAMVPSGRIETRSRLDSGITSTQITSGTLYLVPIWLPTGTVVNSITFVAGATNSLATGTHQWFGLYDSSRVQLAVTSDDTSNAWAAQTAKTLTIATVAAGSASSFTTTYTGLHYLGLMVAASTVVNITGGGASNPTVENATPAFGAANTGQAGPNAFPFTAAAPSAAGPLAYAYVS